MDDKELIKAVMDKQGWNQAEVARYLDVHRAKITKVLKDREQLHPSSRKLLEMLLEQEEGDE